MSWHLNEIEQCLGMRTRQSSFLTGQDRQRDIEVCFIEEGFKFIQMYTVEGVKGAQNSFLAGKSEQDRTVYIREEVRGR